MVAGMRAAPGLAAVIWAGLKLGFGAFLLGFSGWYWTRAALAVSYHTPDIVVSRQLNKKTVAAIDFVGRLPIVLAAVVAVVSVTMGPWRGWGEWAVVLLVMAGYAIVAALIATIVNGVVRTFQILCAVLSWASNLAGLAAIILFIFSIFQRIGFLLMQGNSLGPFLRRGHLGSMFGKNTTAGGPYRLSPRFDPPPPIKPYAFAAWPKYLVRLIAALLSCGPFGFWFGLGFVALSLASGFVIASWPPWIQQTLDAPVAGMVALGFVIPPVTIFMMIVTELPVPIPVRRPFGWLLMAVCLFGHAPKGLYNIRTVDTKVQRPMDLESAVRAWVSECHPGTGDIPLVIVSAEGGASRSALWTLSAMRQLDHETGGKFGQNLFAISSVSGGSLGAVTYLRMLRAGESDCRAPVNWSPGTVEPLRELQRADFLAPALATYFLTDSLRRFIPDWFFRSVPSRAVALERGFERYWDAALPLKTSQPVNPGFLGLRSQSFGRLDHNAARLPHLLLNGTDVKLGRRLITSTIGFGAADDLFADSDDLLGVLGGDVPAATAVTNSARFPFISPAGGFSDGTEQGRNRQVIDGGYFENYGLATSLELARALENIGKITLNGERHIRTVIVVISNDAEFYADQLSNSIPHCLQWPISAMDPAQINTLKAQSQGGVLEILAPVIGLAATRSAHNQIGLVTAQRRFCGPRTAAIAHNPQSGMGHQLIHIALRRPGVTGAERSRNENSPPIKDGEYRDEAAPMNWVQNPASYNLLVEPDGALGARFNVCQMMILRDALKLPVHDWSACKPSN